MLFSFTATATTEIYTLSLHDALPIWFCADLAGGSVPSNGRDEFLSEANPGAELLHRQPRRLPSSDRHGGQSGCRRSEEHTSELQSRLHLVCRLLLEKKKTRGEWADVT